MTKQAKVTPIVAVRVTPVDEKGNPCSKICRQARIAAEHWTLIRNGVWWSKKGWLYPRPQAHDMARARAEKMYRRVRPIFAKVLP